MPAAVVAAIAADYVATAVAAEVFAIGFAMESAFVIGAAEFVGMAAGGIAGSLINSGMRGAMYDNAPAGFTSQAQQRTHVLRSAVTNRTIVYGRAMVSGPLVFAASSTDNQTLHLVIALAGHEIDAIESIQFNDEALGTLDGSGNVTDGSYAGKVLVKKHLGAAGDPADADLVGAGVGWTAAHKLAGVAYLYLRLTWDQNVFPRGIPNIKAVVRGKKLYDPRTATTAWSQNWALAVRDYLTSSYGLGCTAAELDEASFIGAANIADEDVALAAGGTEDRYTANGVIDRGGTPRQILEALLSAGAGVLVWSGGKWTLSAGAYDTPDATAITADDLRGPVRVRARLPRQSLFNAVRGTYVDPAKYWQPGDFPPVTNATYASADGGVYWQDMALPFTTSPATAQRLAKIRLERSRQPITLEFPAKLTQFRRRVWDVVPVTIAQLGFSAKPFRVIDWKFSDAGGVDLVLQEEAAASYDWNSGMETVIDPAPDTHLPNPWELAAPGTPTVTESLFETTGSAGVKARVTMTMPGVADAFVTDYLPEYRPAGGTWYALPPTHDTAVDINDISPGLYEFRYRARNSIGVASGYSAVCTQEISGLTAAPSDPAWLYVAPRAGMAYLSWPLTADLDVRIGGRAVLRHSPLLSGAVWENGIVLDEFQGAVASGVLPLLSGTYMVKFQDSTGHWSDGFAAAVAADSMLSGWATVAISTQHPVFGGAKTNAAVASGALQLDSYALIDGMTDPIDTWGSIDSIGGISATGSYAFDATMDLATVATRNFIATVQSISFDTGDLIDSRTTFIDDWDDFDGAVVNDCDATLYIRTTNDDPAGAPSWSGWVPFMNADFSCRAAQFRLDMASGNRTHNLSISALSVTARIPT